MLRKFLVVRLQRGSGVAFLASEEWNGLLSTFLYAQFVPRGEEYYRNYSVYSVFWVIRHSF